MPAAVNAHAVRVRLGLPWALATITARELVWGRRAVAREIRHWRQAAERIPDPRIRADALEVIERKRGNTDGAALFWVLVRRRDLGLLRLIIAHEMIWDFLDCASERASYVGERNGQQLHLAVVESLDASRGLSDYYRFHPWREDGGYLRSLVETCRRGLEALPSYSLVASVVIRDAERAVVQSLNHAEQAGARDQSLQAWALKEYPDSYEAEWFELTAAASAPLHTYAMLALAAESRSTPALARRTYDAYFPWVSLATVMLDSYVDQVEDSAAGAHSYLAHYESLDEAFTRIAEIIEVSMDAVMALPQGARHAVVVSCMVAMYLSKDSARAPDRRTSTRAFVRAGGSSTRALLPALRLWRVRYGQQAA